MKTSGVISSSLSLQRKRLVRGRDLAYQQSTESSSNREATSGFTAKWEKEPRSRSICQRLIAPLKITSIRRRQTKHPVGMKPFYWLKTMKPFDTWPEIY